MGQQNDAESPSSVLERMAALVAAVDEESLPPEVIHEAGRRLLNAVGCMLGGSDSGPARSVQEAVGAASGPVTIVGHRQRAGIAGGALANATALRYLDYMDGHPGPYPCHPCFVLPAMLAAAESADATGLALARAIALGYEIDIRMQLASGDPDITAHGWSGSTNLAFAVPAGAAGLLAWTRRHWRMRWPSRPCTARCSTPLAAARWRRARRAWTAS